LKPPIDAKERGWTQNSRGGWQPPDNEIDLVDIPALSPDAKTLSRGLMSEYLKRRREQKRHDADTNITDLSG
jgi:hypothetical protein